MRDKATVMVHINAGGKGVRERRITFGDYWDPPSPVAPHMVTLSQHTTNATQQYKQGGSHLMLRAQEQR